MPGSNLWPAGEEPAGERGTAMTIEVIDIRITDREAGTVRMVARDVSEENLQYFEPYRDDGFEKEFTYEWNTRDSRQFLAFKKWLKSNRVTQNAQTFGEAMAAVTGRILSSPSGRYRVWE